MRVQFKTAAIPTRAAKRYKSRYNLPEARARHVTAFVLGYRDWHELHAQLGAAAPSPLDEELSEAECEARLRYQTERLELLFPSKTQDERDDLRATIMLWRPSAAQPQRQPEVLRAAEYDAYAVRRMARVLEAEFSNREPTLREFVARAHELAIAEGVEFRLMDITRTDEELAENSLGPEDRGPGERTYDLVFTRNKQRVFDDVICVSCGPEPEERVLEFQQES